METARILLNINAIKTKYMIAGGDRGRPSGIVAELVFDGDMFEEFVGELLKSSTYQTWS